MAAYENSERGVATDRATHGTGGRALSAALVGIDVSSTELLALLLLALVYPLLLFVAARSEPEWTYVALLLIPRVVVVWRAGHGGGIFRGSTEVAQAFPLAAGRGFTFDYDPRREAEEAMREADRKKDRFIATLAHELRHPLTPIRNTAELLGSRHAGPAAIEGTWDAAKAASVSLSRS